MQPPFTIFKSESKKCHPPLGLAYLAGILKQEHHISVLDALAEGYHNQENLNREYVRYGLSFNGIKKRIEFLKPDVVGISCLFSAQAENVHQICSIVKEVNKKIITVVGGAHPSAKPEETIYDNNVDYTVIGEGENAFSALLECLNDKKDICGIDGIGFRHNGDIKVNRRKKYEDDLDNLPFPHWDIFPLERYFEINNPHGSPARKVPFLPMITSRGCPFECIFCSIHNLWGRNYRTRSAENVLSEMNNLRTKYGVKEILFEDDNLTLDKERAISIFRGIIDRKFDICWNVPNGLAVETLDDGIMELMKRSGCYRISIGVESGDEYMLKNIIKKPITLMKIKPIINKAKRLNIETVAFFVVGLPGENHESLKNTFRFAESLEADNINFFFATPLPGTRLFEVCKKESLINTDIDYARLKSDCPSFATKEFSINELRKAVAYEKLKLYFLFLLRHPGRFFSKFVDKLLKDPAYFLRFKRRHF